MATFTRTFFVSQPAVAAPTQPLNPKLRGSGVNPKVKVKRLPEGWGQPLRHPRLDPLTPPGHGCRDRSGSTRRSQTPPGHPRGSTPLDTWETERHPRPRRVPTPRHPPLMPPPRMPPPPVGALPVCPFPGPLLETLGSVSDVAGARLTLPPRTHQPSTCHPPG